MTYMISGLSPDHFTPLFAMGDAELATVIINACGCNLKKSIVVQDILGFDPYKKPEIVKSKEEQEDELHYLKNKMGGEGK